MPRKKTEAEAPQEMEGKFGDLIVKLQEFAKNNPELVALLTKILSQVITPKQQTFGAGVQPMNFDDPSADDPVECCDQLCEQLTYALTCALHCRRVCDHHHTA